MTKLAVINPGLTPDQVDLVKKTICKDATNDELKLFLYHCERTRLDPLSRQIYFMKFGGKVTIIVGIDGLRAIAARTGQYAGSDDPIFDNEKKPTKATVAVYKMIEGQRCAFTASARWDQYYPGKGRAAMWDKMPHLMLGKVAEALALRKAFPNILSGLYGPEEMDQAIVDEPIIKDEKPLVIEAEANKTDGPPKCCNRTMMISKYFDKNMDEFPYYCVTCRKKVPSGITEREEP